MLHMVEEGAAGLEAFARQFKERLLALPVIRPDSGKKLGVRTWSYDDDVAADSNDSPDPDGPTESTDDEDPA